MPTGRCTTSRAIAIQSRTEPPSPPALIVHLLASLLLAVASLGGDLYSCILSRGERLSRDRLIEKCAGVEQTVRRRDGRIEKIPPAPSPDEIAHREAEKERAEVAL